MKNQIDAICEYLVHNFPIDLLAGLKIYSFLFRPRLLSNIKLSLGLTKVHKYYLGKCDAELSCDIRWHLWLECSGCERHLLILHGTGSGLISADLCILCHRACSSCRGNSEKIRRQISNHNLKISKEIWSLTAFNDWQIDC